MAANGTLLEKMQEFKMEDLVEVMQSPAMISEWVLIGTSVLTIYVGSKWSVSKKLQHRAKGLSEEGLDDEEDEVQVSAREAAMFPIAGSGVLLSLYVCYKLFPKELFNRVLSFYFVVVAAYAMSAALYPIVRNNYLAAAIAVASAAAWWQTGHFAVNNAIAIGICITSLWKIKLPSFAVSWIMLWGLFLYDIWWVFGTEVMVSVARNIDAPVLLKIPNDLFAEEYKADKMMMLGLGDIVIPGFFVAMCLRFDYFKASQRAEKTASVAKPYFISCLVCYFLGLLNTVLIMMLFKHAQPALLYLVPWITIGTLIVTIVRGDLSTCYNYSEDPPKEEEELEDLSWQDTLYNVIIADLLNLEKVKGKPKQKKDQDKKDE